MFTFTMFEEMMDGLKEISKLAGESMETIRLAKTVSKDVAKIWLAKAVTDICEAQNMPVEDFLDFVKGDFVKMYSSVKDDLGKMQPEAKEDAAAEKTYQDKPDMDVFGFMSWML